MSHRLNVVLSDETFDAIQRQAHTTGSSPAKVASESLEVSFKSARLCKSEAQKEEARLRFRRHFGEIHSGNPTGADNESIDADLASEYANIHEKL